MGTLRGIPAIQKISSMCGRVSAAASDRLNPVFDLALLPIGAYKPCWFMAEKQIDPLEAVQIHLALKAKRSVGIHWGVFELTDESLDQPPQNLADATKLHQLRAAEFTVMAIGETRLLPYRTKP